MNLADFMLNVAKDPQALAQFQQNPQATMTKAGLTDNEKAAVLSKDPAAIHKAILGAGLQASDVTVVVIVTPPA